MIKRSLSACGDLIATKRGVVSFQTWRKANAYAVPASVVDGMARACRENGCVLLGGETAEMPDFYPVGEYDLAGFIVGVVDKAKVIDGKSIGGFTELRALDRSGELAKLLAA